VSSFATEASVQPCGVAAFVLYDCLNAASLPLERLRYESSVCLALTQPERDLGRVSLNFFCQLRVLPNSARPERVQRRSYRPLLDSKLYNMTRRCLAVEAEEQPRA
jgi:hypothetical protein